MLLSRTNKPALTDEQKKYGLTYEYSKSKGELVSETEDYYILINIFPYDNTDEHLLVIPKREDTVISFKQMNKWNDEGYTILKQSKMNQSVKHIPHIHLIKFKYK